MAGHLHFNAASHACDSETKVKKKAHRVNITNTTNPVPVPLARKFHVERIIILTQLTLFMFFSSVHVLYKQIHGLTL